MVEKLCLAAATIGGLLMALSLLSGFIFPPENTWTLEKASRMSELSREAYLLHIEVNQADRNPVAGGDMEAGEVQQNYRSVVRELATLKSELEAAQQRPETIARLLRWSGVVLLLLALVALRFLKSTESAA